MAIVAMLLPGAVAGAQRREHKRAERAEIMQLEAEWQQAQISDNIPAMDRLLAEDFLGITAGGQVVTKAQQLDRMRTRQIELRRLDISDDKIKISGKLAVVTSLAQMEGSMEGHPVNGSFRSTRVYQWSYASGWRITSFEATRVPGGGTISRDGAAVSSPAAASRGPRAAEPNFVPASQAGPGSLTPRS